MIDPEEILKDLDKETPNVSQDDAAVYQGDYFTSNTCEFSYVCEFHSSESKYSLLYHKACLGYSLPNIIVYILSIPGTRSFMADKKNLIEDCEGAEMVSCNKDTAGKHRLQKWSRGIFIVATAGGHIEYWQPLYK